MKTIEELKEFLEEFDLEEDAYFSEEETISAIIGFEDKTRCLVYDYDKLIESFIEHFRKYDKESKSDEELYEEALEWVEYNTIRSLDYSYCDFILYDENNEEVGKFLCFADAQKKKEEINNENYTIVQKNYIMPIIVHNSEKYGF